MAGLEGRERTLTRELPGGWRQRLALGCAILHEPPIVFLDEPTGGVDPLSRRQFWDLIGDLSRQGVTVLVTTHYLDEAEHCHRIAIIQAGKLAALGTATELKQVFADAADRRDPRVAAGRGDGDPRQPRDVEKTSLFGTAVHAVLKSAAIDPRLLSAALKAEGIDVTSIGAVTPSLEDVFLDVVERVGARVMRKTLAVASKELRQILRDRRTLLILLFVPAFFLLLYGYALNFDIRNVTLAVQDQDRSAKSRELVSAFVNSGYFSLVGYVDSPTELDAWSIGPRRARSCQSLPASSATVACGSR